jgi:hypothetical protein
LLELLFHKDIRYLTICVVDFVNKLPRVFESMVTHKNSLQDALNGLMKTESTDGFVTRIWSTCPRMLTIIGCKGKADDNLSYIIDDSTSHLPITSVLERVQGSSKQVLKVSITGQKVGGASFSFGDLYAHFLIEGHKHTTHYVNMSDEFPIDEDIQDFDTELTAVSLRCKKSVSETKIIVLVELDSTEKKEGTSDKSASFANSEQSTSELRRPASREILMNKLKERLLKDGIHTVVVLTNPNMTLQANLSKEVIPADKKVSIC